MSTHHRDARACMTLLLVSAGGGAPGGRGPHDCRAGAVTGTRRLARVYRDKVALIGDASGGVDAITGAGLCLAFQQAEPLGKALASGISPSMPAPTAVWHVGQA